MRWRAAVARFVAARARPASQLRIVDACGGGGGRGSYQGLEGWHRFSVRWTASPSPAAPAFWSLACSSVVVRWSESCRPFLRWRAAVQGLCCRPPARKRGLGVLLGCIAAPLLPRRRRLWPPVVFAPVGGRCCAVLRDDCVRALNGLGELRAAVEAVDGTARLSNERWRERWWGTFRNIVICHVGFLDAPAAPARLPPQLACLPQLARATPPPAPPRHAMALPYEMASAPCAAGKSLGPT